MEFHAPKPPPSAEDRGRALHSSSPEFEFCKIRDPSFPHPDLPSADQLFSGGFLLPLHRLHLSEESPLVEVAPDPESADLSAPAAALSASKRWRQIFRRGDRKSLDFDDRGPKEKEIGGVKERRRKSSAGAGVGLASAELNINIWPFSRSRSAGNGVGRPRATAPARKVSSAPCSRSNSTGESKSRKLPHSPSAGAGAGVHLGKSSPVLKLRRAARRTPDQTTEDEAKRAAKAPTSSKTRVLSLNVPMCIGYRPSQKCSRGEISGADGTADGGEEFHLSNLLSIRSLFTKKVY